MAEHDELVKVLNDAISLEYTAALQYNQHSMLVTGHDMLHYESLFRESAREALDHAKMWGDRIVYLGGVPRADIGTVRQPANITEMLEADLELEKRAVEVYSHAHKVCRHEPTRYMLENHILDEDRDVERLQKLLGRIALAQTTSSGTRKAAAA